MGCGGSKGKVPADGVLEPGGAGRGGGGGDSPRSWDGSAPQTVSSDDPYADWWPSGRLKPMSGTTRAMVREAMAWLASPGDANVEAAAAGNTDQTSKTPQADAADAAGAAGVEAFTHLRQKGLYRVPGSYDKAKLTAHSYRTGGRWVHTSLDGVSHAELGANTVASAIKVCLMEHAPITSYAAWDALREARDDSSQVARALRALPLAEWEMVRDVCAHLRAVAAHEEANGMGVDNLTRVFAETLLRGCEIDELMERSGVADSPADGQRLAMVELSVKQKVLKTMLLFPDVVFAPRERGSDSGGDGEASASLAAAAAAAAAGGGDAAPAPAPLSQVLKKPESFREEEPSPGRGRRTGAGTAGAGAGADVVTPGAGSAGSGDDPDGWLAGGLTPSAGSRSPVSYTEDAIETMAFSDDDDATTPGGALTPGDRSGRGGSGGIRRHSSGRLKSARSIRSARSGRSLHSHKSGRSHKSGASAHTPGGGSGTPHSGGGGGGGAFNLSGRHLKATISWLSSEGDDDDSSEAEAEVQTTSRANGDATGTGAADVLSASMLRDRGASPVAATGALASPVAATPPPAPPPADSPSAIAVAVAVAGEGDGAREGGVAPLDASAEGGSLELGDSLRSIGEHAPQGRGGGGVTDSDDESSPRPTVDVARASDRKQQAHARARDGGSGGNGSADFGSVDDDGEVSFGDSGLMSGLSLGLGDPSPQRSTHTGGGGGGGVSVAEGGGGGRGLTRASGASAVFGGGGSFGGYTHRAGAPAAATPPQSQQGGGMATGRGVDDARSGPRVGRFEALFGGDSPVDSPVAPIAAAPPAQAHMEAVSADGDGHVSGGGSGGNSGGDSGGGEVVSELLSDAQLALGVVDAPPAQARAQSQAGDTANVEVGFNGHVHMADLAVSAATGDPVSPGATNRGSGTGGGGAARVRTPEAAAAPVSVTRRHRVKQQRMRPASLSPSPTPHITPRHDTHRSPSPSHTHSISPPRSPSSCSRTDSGSDSGSDSRSDSGSRSGHSGDGGDDGSYAWERPGGLEPGVATYRYSVAPGRGAPTGGGGSGAAVRGRGSSGGAAQVAAGAGVVVTPRRHRAAVAGLAPASAPAHAPVPHTRTRTHRHRHRRRSSSPARRRHHRHHRHSGHHGRTQSRSHSPRPRPLHSSGLNSGHRHHPADAFVADVLPERSARQYAQQPAVFELSQAQVQAAAAREYAASEARLRAVQDEYPLSHAIAHGLPYGALLEAHTQRHAALEATATALGGIDAKGASAAAPGAGGSAVSSEPAMESAMAAHLLERMQAIEAENRRLRAAMVAPAPATASVTGSDARAPHWGENQDANVAAVGDGGGGVAEDQQPEAPAAATLAASTPATASVPRYGDRVFASHLDAAAAAVADALGASIDLPLHSPSLKQALAPRPPPPPPPSLGSHAAPHARAPPPLRYGVHALQARTDLERGLEAGGALLKSQLAASRRAIADAGLYEHSAQRTMARAAVDAALHTLGDDTNDDGDGGGGGGDPAARGRHRAAALTSLDPHWQYKAFALGAGDPSLSARAGDEYTRMRHVETRVRATLRGMARQRYTGGTRTHHTPVDSHSMAGVPPPLRTTGYIGVDSSGLGMGLRHTVGASVAMGAAGSLRVGAPPPLPVSLRNDSALLLSSGAAEAEAEVDAEDPSARWAADADAAFNLKFAQSSTDSSYGGYGGYGDDVFADPVHAREAGASTGDADADWSSASLRYGHRIGPQSQSQLFEQSHLLSLPADLHMAPSAGGAPPMPPRRAFHTGAGPMAHRYDVY